MKITNYGMKNISRNLYFKNIKFTRFSTANYQVFDEIKISAKETQFHYPSRGAPEFKNGVFTLFEYLPEPIKTDEEGSYQRLQQVPYEIKEHALKGFMYTFFLTWVGRFLSNFFTYTSLATNLTVWPYLPLAVFSFHYLKSINYMYNSIVNIKLKEDGLSVIFEFKNGLKRPLEVEIWRIKKLREENFLNECYTDPFLFPIQVDFTDLTGQYSLKSQRNFYIYGDGHQCIKDGEILRAILNTQSIKLK